jgi:hypothetical protein
MKKNASSKFELLGEVQLQVGPQKNGQWSAEDLKKITDLSHFGGLEAVFGKMKPSGRNAADMKLAVRDLRAAHCYVVRAHAESRRAGAGESIEGALFRASHHLGKGLKRLKQCAKTDDR